MFESAPEPQRKEKLHADDARFREWVQINQSFETRYLWGLREATLLHNLDHESELTDVKEVWSKSVLSQSKFELAKLAIHADNPFAALGFDELLTEAITEDDNVHQELEKIFPDAIVDWDGQPVAFSGPVAENIERLPDNLYRRILEIHVAAYEVKNQELQEQLPAMQEKFLGLLQPYINKNNLPLTPEFLQRRLAEVPVRAGDIIGYSISSGLLGDFDAQNDVVVIPLEEITIVTPNMKTRAERQFYTYTHEMLHALSGRTIYGNIREADNSLLSSRVQRLGLLAEGRFRWLNEAMTERINLDLLNEKEGSYPQERALLDLLIQQGISYSHLQRAYFEQHVPKKETSSLVSWREMMKDFNQTFKPGFLVKLDKYIHHNGLDKTIAQMREGWEKI